MPKTNRSKEIGYTIILIHSETDDVKLLDITTDSNFRNFQWSVANAIKTDKKMTNVVINEIRKYGESNFTYQKLDFYFGFYTDAIKKLNNISNELGLISNHSVSQEVIDLRKKLINSNTEQEEQLKTDDEQVKEVLDDVINEVVSQCDNCETPQETLKVKCEFCEKFMLKSNLKRHIKNKHT